MDKRDEYDYTSEYKVNQGRGSTNKCKVLDLVNLMKTKMVNGFILNQKDQYDNAMKSKKFNMSNPLKPKISI